MLDPVKTLLQKMTERGFDPIEAMALVTEVLATRGIDQAAAKRREWDREYRRKRRLKTPDIHPTSTRHSDIYVETTYVKSMDVEVKELPVKQVPLNQVPVSRARARKKVPSEFPTIWPTQEVLDAGLKLLPTMEAVIWECDGMRDWAQSKDERRADWLAFARQWFRTAAKKSRIIPSFSAKPLTQFQLDAKTRKEKYDRLAEFARSGRTEMLSEGGGKLGTPDDQIIPPNW